MSAAAQVEQFEHQAVLYDSLEELVSAVVGFVRDGLDRGEPALVALPPGRLKAVRLALGPQADEVRLLDAAAVGRNPACLLAAWQGLLEAHPTGPVRGVAELAWRGRREPELAECRLQEALLNLAFAGGRPWRLLCAYDAASLAAGALEEVGRTHHRIVPGREGSDYLGPAHARAEFARPLPPAPEDAVEMRFHGEGLGELRQAVRREVDAVGLGEDAADDLVLAVHELAANSVLHGGGAGILRSWVRPDSLVIEVADTGVIEDPLAGREVSGAFEESGRGLWIAHQLCDLVQVRSSSVGTTVRLHVWR